MHHRACRSALENADVRVANLLVRHRLAVFAVRATRMPIDLHKLVGVPAVVLRHPGRNVVVALPEDELYRSIVEPHHYIGIRPNTPRAVPHRIEMKRRIEGTERLPPTLG